MPRPANSLSPAPRPPAIDAEYFQKLFESFGFPMITCSPTGEIVAWNTAAARLFCESEAPIAGRTLADVLPEESRETVREQFQRAIRTRSHVEVHVSFAAASADPIEFAMLLTPVFDRETGFVGVAAVFRDVTVRMRLQRKLEKAERLSLLGQLSGAVAHHYNNLLCSIATSLEYAMNMNTMGAMRRALTRTSDAVTRGAAITRQLLAFAQADHRSDDLADLTETVLIFFDEIEPRLATRGVRLLVDWQPIPFSAVLREPLRIILGNVAQNALDAMPTGGTLTATLARRDDESACISMSDSGGGIDPEHMEHLFEPFFTTKGELGRGSAHNPGLGLAVAHGLVHELGGTISASNLPGSGARFDIVLPITPPA